MERITHGPFGLQVFTGGAFAENTALLWCLETRAAVVVDPGAAAGAALDAAEEMGLDLQAIVLTHAHLDHVEGIPHVLDRVALPIHLHPDDRPLYDAAPAQAQMFGLTAPALPPPDEALVPGEPFPVGACTLEIRFTPGHAPGHVILVGEGFVIAGDTVFAGSIGRTDLPGGDLETLLSSIRREILSLDDDTVLYPGHGPATTVGHERRSNPFLRSDFGGSAFA